MRRELWIPVIPKVKQRPRMGRRGRVFTPQQTLEYEAAIAAEWADTFDDQFPDDMLLAVDVTYTRDGSQVVISEADLDRIPVGLGRGDLDNFVKATLDGLQGTAFKDDKTVVELSARKAMQVPSLSS